jgi:crotonobetainyl-CoA:carnitine CoA-transferase CaiB-like acyl-CoA transferase
MAGDPRFASNAGRVEHEAEIDAALAQWCERNDSQFLLDILDQARVPAGPIYNVEDMIEDRHFNARGLFETVEIDGKPLKIPAILPKLERTPGATRWPGGELGSHNNEVLMDMLGLNGQEMDALRSEGVIN